MKKEKPKYSMFQTLGFMLSMAWKHCKLVVFLQAVRPVLNVGVDLTQLYIAPEILRKVETHAPLPEVLTTITVFTLLLVVLLILQQYVVKTKLMRHRHVSERIREAINRKASVTSYPNAVDPRIIKLRQAALDTTNGFWYAGEHIWASMAKLATDLGSGIIYLFLLSNVNVFLGIVILGTAVAGYFITRHLDMWWYTHKSEKEAAIHRHNYISLQAESVSFAKEIRIFDLSGWLLDIQKQAIGLYRDFVERREVKRMIARLINLVLAVSRNAVAYVYLLHMVLEEGMSAADFLLYFNAASGFAAQVTTLLGSLADLHRECSELSVVQEYLDLEEPFRFEGGEQLPQADAYELRLEKVTFRYPGTDEDIFRDLNLTIRPGEKLAIVGLNGAGKTTLVKLLCGFFDPDAGRVLLNGTDIRRFNRQEYYRLFSAVFQEYSLLDIKLKENITQDLGEPDMQRLEDCVEKAGLTDFIAKLPKGYDTYIGRDVHLDGVLLSGGQTQRLLLARALYKDGKILVLDEPTAALDPLAENDIYMRYNEMTEGKTALFISHRLASTRFCDRILFLADGRVAEEGTHEQLLARNGEYAKLFEVQSRYYQEGGVQL